MGVDVSTTRDGVLSEALEWVLLSDSPPSLLLSRRIVEAAEVKLFIPRTDFGTENFRHRGSGGDTMIEKGGELLSGDSVVVRRVVHVEDEVNLLVKGSSGGDVSEGSMKGE